MWWNVVWCDVMRWKVSWCDVLWIYVIYDIMLHMDMERSSYDIDVVALAFKQWRLFLFLVVSCVVVFPTDRNDSHLKWESCLWVENTTTHETIIQGFYLKCCGLMLGIEYNFGNRVKILKNVIEC
jgi:hypothetical protein